jgi:hypothetical protein
MGLVLYNQNLNSYVTVTALRHPFMDNALIVRDTWVEDDQVKTNFDLASKRGKIGLMPGVSVVGEL